jgi:signal transduction histidine kinase/CheY-like chemotaxis protein
MRTRHKLRRIPALALLDSRPAGWRPPDRLALVPLLLALAAAVVIAGGLVFMALRQDRQAEDDMVRLVEGALKAERSLLEAVVAGHARSREAVERLVSGRDTGWLDEYVGRAEILVLDAAGMDVGGGDDGLSRLAARARAQLPGAVSGFLRPAGANAAVRLAIAAAIAPAAGLDGDGRVLLATVPLDDAFLRRVGRRFDLDDLRVLAPQRAGAAASLPLAGLPSAGLPLAEATGTVLGWLVTTAETPGSRLLLRAAAPVGLMLAGLAALGVLAVRRARAAQSMAVASARLLRIARRDLAQAGERFHDFTLAASDWFWETGPDHRTIFISQRRTGPADVDVRGLLGEGLAGLAALIEDDEASDELCAAIAHGQPFHDVDVVCGDVVHGEDRRRVVIRLSGQPVLDEKGDLRGYRGTATDITIQTLAVIEARFMEDVAHDALDSISEGFVLFSSEGRLLFCNERYRLAYPNLADILVPGTSFEDILRTAARRGGFLGEGDDMASWVRDRMTRHLEHTAPVDRRLSDGCWYRISEHATGSGGIVKLLIDITELKLREEELAGQTARLKATLANISQGLCMFDGDGRLAAWNDDFPRLLGLADGFVWFGRPLGDFAGCLGETAPDVARLFALSAPAAPAASPAASPARGIAGPVRAGERTLDVHIGPIAEGGFVATFSDVTDRDRFEAEMQRSQKMEAVGRMAGGIAHEFNNMLTAIGGFARLVERSPDDASRVVTYVREIAKASDRAAALTAQLLDFSRRRVSDETEVVALAGLVHDLRVFLKPLMTDGIHLELDIRDASLHANVNPVTLNQALLNLALNARDAMAGGGALTITLDRVTPDRAFLDSHEELSLSDSVSGDSVSGAAGSGDYAVVRVADEGCGVHDDIRDRIWEPFFTTKEPGKGTGLGLWMVYGTARQAGGVVDMDSEIGRGTVFSIYLPLADPPAEVPAGVDTVSLPEGEPAVILLVDDEEAVRSFIRLTLEEAGCTVVEACDGVDALERFDAAGGLFDLVVSDFSMPRMAGPDLAVALEHRNPDLRMLFLTGFAERETVEALTARPGRQVLMKPVSPDGLIQAVRDLLES